MGDSGVGDFRVGDCAPPPQKAAAKKNRRPTFLTFLTFLKSMPLIKIKGKVMSQKIVFKSPQMFLN